MCGGVKCLHLSFCVWAGFHVPAGALFCFSGEYKNALRSYRLPEGKLSVSRSRKHLEQKAAVMHGGLKVGQRLLCWTLFPGSEMGKLGAGFNLSDSPDKCKLRHYMGTYEGVAVLILGGTGSGDGWLLSDFHHRCSAW